MLSPDALEDVMLRPWRRDSQQFDLRGLIFSEHASELLTGFLAGWDEQITALALFRELFGRA